MSYDFFVDFRIEKKEDVDELTSCSGKYTEVKEPMARILLLNTAFATNEELMVYAKVGERNTPAGLKAIIHSNGNYNDSMVCKLSMLDFLKINYSIDISNLPKGSWLLEFQLTLKHPFISRDDIPFYIIENPMRKDKVFGIPVTSAMAWKGNLRWTMMKVHLEPEVNNPEDFANVRYQHTLLFGTEKGMEEMAKGWTKYLDEICPRAKAIYRNKVMERFRSHEIPSLTGMLYFYPTFWDRIDMEVINPHDRKTKTGKNPIYYEVVPRGAKGIFKLLYIPFYYINERDIKSKVLDDLANVATALKKMMLNYGFSAKKSSGYGVIEENWDKTASNLLIINEIQKNIKFINFEELEIAIKDLQEENK